MIVTAEITAINQSKGNLQNNAYEIELSILNQPGDSRENIIQKRLLATACVPGDFYNTYEVGDVVYVGFLHNVISRPVILGKIYKGLSDNHSGSIHAKALSVSNSVQLPPDTLLGNTPLGAFLSMLEAVKDMQERIKTLEAASWQETLYTITWKNDAEVLKTETLKYGQLPIWDGPEPVKEDDEQYTYTFAGWSPSPIPAIADATYKAQFNATPIAIDDYYLVTLSETDGDANKTTLQEALNNHEKVRIKTGTYPLTPSVVVNSGILDLGNSIITSTASKFSGGLICLAGDNPTVQNGELAGNFHEKSPGIGSEDFFENESLVSPVTAAYTNALVENVKMHNCWGYAVSERGAIDQKKLARIGIPDETNNYVYPTNSTYYGSTVTKGEDNWWTCTSVELPLSKFAGTPPLKYVFAQNGLGYYRIISDTQASYTFTLEDGSKQVFEDWQGMPIEIPTGAVSLSIAVRWKPDNTNWHSSTTVEDDGTVKRHYKGYTVRFSDYAGGLTVRNCKTYYNSSLGMTGGLTGVTLAENCESWGQGHPEEGVSDSQTTIGFIDVEDVVTSLVILRNCTSRDELNFAMLGACRTIIEGCTAEGKAVIYRGVTASITNTDAPIGTFSLDTTTPTEVTNCIIRSATSNKLSKVVKTTDCTFYNIPVRPAEHDTNGTYIYTKFVQVEMPDGTRVTGAGDIIGIRKKLKISAQMLPDSMWNAPTLFAKFAPQDGSDVQITCNNSGEIEAQTYGLKATGDCYGVTLDDTLFPSGHTIKNCVFTPGNYKHWAKPAEMYGTFENCTFNLDSRAFYIPSAHMYDKRVIFRNCIIHNTDNYLFGFRGNIGIGRGTELIFENCIIDNTDKIAATRANTPGIATAGVPTITINNT